MMSECQTLLVKNLPNNLSASDVEELMKRFEASRVRLMKPKSKMHGCAFVSFKNPLAATEAMKRLHQLEVLGRRLVVIYSKTENHILAEDCVDMGETSSKKANSSSSIKDETVRFPAVSEILGINHPLNIKYKYLFPPPNPSVVSRISNALINVPKFYWQVLLLMNKMNLAPPFGPSDRAMPLGKEQNVDKTLVDDEMQSSEESEMESGEEHEELLKAANSSTLVSVKRKRKGDAVSNKRRMQSILASVVEGSSGTTEPSIAPSEVFDVPTIQVQKKIEFKLHVGTDEHIIENLGKDVGETDPGSFGTFTSETSEKIDIEEASPEFISLKDLKDSQISKEGMEILPVFKNYFPGKPSNKLYIKNLSKQADEIKLRFVYGSFVSRDCLDDQEKFSIRLMKEGRMKGQAFITFPDETSAQLALEHTNGFVLFDKPIVVQFAKTKS